MTQILMNQHRRIAPFSPDAAAYRSSQKNQALSGHSNKLL